MPTRFLVSCAIIVTVLGFAPAAPAQTEAERQEIQAANDAVARATQHSGVVHLADEATLTLPPGVDFVPQAETDRLMLAYGSSRSDSRLGYFTPAAGSGKNWVVVVYFKEDGYIKDDDAKDWDEKKLLHQLQDNNAWLNESRRAQGDPEIEVAGWLHPPEYDRANHRLVWAVDAREKGSPREADAHVSFHAVALGRDGYIDLGLATDKSKLAAQIPDVLKLLNNLAYNEGRRYEDFDASTDDIGDYGLSILMGAGVPK
ncbi:DUF2167 domain-containing protein [Achromobacter aloeverae]